jgi:cytochrome c6
VTQVTNGKNAMSAFGGRLSDDDIANVATYVISEACLRSIQALFVTY